MHAKIFEEKAAYDFRAHYSLINRGSRVLRPLRVSLLTLQSYEPYTQVEVEETPYNCKVNKTRLDVTSPT